MKATRVVVLVLVCGIVAVACDGSDKSTGSADAGALSGDGGTKSTTLDLTRPAKEQCQVLSNTICAREAACLMRPANVACGVDLNAEGLCDRVSAVRGDMAACHGDIRSVSCASLFPGQEFDIPNSCTGVFEFSQTPGEMQCEALVRATCERIIPCADEPPSEAELPAAIDVCTQFLSSDFECFAVTGVSATYPDCMAQTQAVTCEQLNSEDETLNPLSACTGVLLY